jgi:hypothetical protein
LAISFFKQFSAKISISPWACTIKLFTAVMNKGLIIGGRVYELTIRVESFKGSTLVSSSFACKY